MCFLFLSFINFVHLSVCLSSCLSVCLTKPCCFDFSWCVFFLVFYQFCASVCLSVFLPACLSVCLTEPCCFDFSWCVSEPMCSPRPVPLLELSPCTWASPTCRRRCAWWPWRWCWWGREVMNPCPIRISKHCVWRGMVCVSLPRSRTCPALRCTLTPFYRWALSRWVRIYTGLVEYLTAYIMTVLSKEMSLGTAVDRWEGFMILNALEPLEKKFS